MLWFSFINQRISVKVDCLFNFSRFLLRRAEAAWKLIPPFAAPYVFNLDDEDVTLVERLPAQLNLGGPHTASPLHMKNPFHLTHIRSRVLESGLHPTFLKQQFQEGMLIIV